MGSRILKQGVWLVTVAIGLVGAAASAAGIQVDTEQARATGMATAVVANVEDASAILYNPAGLAHGPGLEVQLGDTLIAPHVRYTAPGGGQSTSSNFGVVPPPHLYVSYGVNDDLAVGFGEFTLYGAVIDYPTDASWPGRFQITHSELQTFDLNPSVAYAFLQHRVRVGAGLNLVRATVDLGKRLGFVDSEGSVELSGATWGYGYNAGVQFDALPEKLQLGLSYRSTVQLDLDGQAHFTGVPVEFSGQAYDQGGRASMKLPQTLALAGALRPIPRLLLELDALYTGWQTFHDITLHFDNPANDQVEFKRWHHSWTLKLGGEYTLSDALRVRAGAMYDQTPSPEATLAPDIPDASRINLSLGAGYRLRPHYTLDVAYMLVILRPTSSSLAYLPGSYRGTANLIGFTLTYR